MEGGSGSMTWLRENWYFFVSIFACVMLWHIQHLLRAILDKLNEPQDRRDALAIEHSSAFLPEPKDSRQTTDAA